MADCLGIGRTRIRRAFSAGFVAPAILTAMLLAVGSVDAADTFLPPPPQTAIRSASEAECQRGAQSIWATAQGAGSLCLKYYRSEAGGPGPLAVVVLADHQMIQRSHDVGERDEAPPDIRMSLLTLANTWSRQAHAPVVILARPGNFGSSGDLRHDMGTTAEVGLTASALDQLKSRLALKGFHLAGVGSGGNLATTLGLTRRDITCTVAGGAWLSERDRLAETGELFSPAKLRAANDPLAIVARSQPQPDLRVLALIDPADPNTPRSALSAFSEAASTHDIHFRQLALPALASDATRARLTVRATMGCVSGMSEQQIDASLKVPAETAQTSQIPAQPALKPIGELILPQIVTPVPLPAPAQPADTLPHTPEQPAPAPIEPQRPPAQLRQTIAPAAPAAVVAPSETATFSRADLIFGKSIDEPTCAAIPFAVWVTSVGAPECIRYYYSDVGGISTRALLFLNGDFTYRGADGQPTVDPDYARLSPADLQHVADVRSRDYGGPMIYLARPGTLGSSGFELLIRHSPREIALIEAAVTEIKRRHGIQTFDLIGHSGGGLVVGALVSDRLDVGCAVSSSGVLATNAWTSQRLNLPQTNSGFLYDPLEHVNEIHPGPDFRYILLTDPADTTVSASSTQLYIDALTAANITHLHIELSASDDAHHDLALHGFRAAIACAHGATDAEISALLTKTVVTNRRMSELSPLGDMPEQATGDKPPPVRNAPKSP